MPSDARADYEEARSILELSPRGSAALLRLVIDKITLNLDAQGKTLNLRIGDLVAHGLDVRVQQLLDTVRVVGNEAVHPGTLDLSDNSELAQTLFVLVNEIVDQMIARPKRIAALFESLPEGTRAAIKRRDG